MAGSKSPVSLDLVYNSRDDIAVWMIRSQARRVEEVVPHIEIIDESMANYEAVAKLAGPKPQVLVEEIVQPKQGEVK